MPEHADQRPFDHPPLAATLEAEAARVRFAAARIQAIEMNEQRLLDLAVRAPDDTQACWLESWADTAWRDAQALRSEHAEHPPVAPC